MNGGCLEHATQVRVKGNRNEQNSLYQSSKEGKKTSEESLCIYEYRIIKGKHEEKVTGHFQSWSGLNTKRLPSL